MLDKINELLTNENLLDMLLVSAGKLALALVIYVIGSWIVRRLVVLINRLLLARGIDQALASFTHHVLSTVLKFAIIIIALEQIGIDTTSLLALLGAAGLAVGLALKDSLSNFASGVMLILLKPFKAGDYIEAAGVDGTVEKITLFNTIMVTVDNKEVIVPNAQIYGGTIINYSARPTRRLDLLIGISYDDDIRKARDLIAAILAADARILTDKEPVIAVNALGESSIDLTVRVWVKGSDYFPLKWHLLETIKTTFDANGVTIPFPQRDIHLHQTA